MKSPPDKYAEYPLLPTLELAHLVWACTLLVFVIRLVSLSRVFELTGVR